MSLQAGKRVLTHMHEYTVLPSPKQWWDLDPRKLNMLWTMVNYSNSVVFLFGVCLFVCFMDHFSREPFNWFEGINQWAHCESTKLWLDPAFLFLPVEGVHCPFIYNHSQKGAVHSLHNGHITGRFWLTLSIPRMTNVKFPHTASPEI